MKNKYIIRLDNPHQELGVLDNLLAGIEVKGDSVALLVRARSLLKGIFDSIEECRVEEAPGVDEALEEEEDG